VKYTDELVSNHMMCIKRFMVIGSGIRVILIREAVVLVLLRIGSH
jgi:hypothetical protein